MSRPGRTLLAALAALLLLLAVGLLVAGVARGSATLQWASFAASALAAVLLVAGELARRRAAGREAAPGQAPDPAPPAEVPVPVGAPTGPPTPPPVDTTPEPVLRSAAEEVAGPSTGAHAVVSVAGPVAVPAIGPDGEPPVEVVEVTDLLLVLDLREEVLVVDEHPRYHLPGCRHLTGVATIPLPMVEARTDGFTPCGTCAPDREFARRERVRRG